MSKTTTAADFRIENVQNVNLNGKQAKIFKAYRNAGTHFEFVGQFSAPAKTAKKSLWRIAADAIS
jgi:hypothetical protein